MGERSRGIYPVGLLRQTLTDAVGLAAAVELAPADASGRRLKVKTEAFVDSKKSFSKKFGGVASSKVSAKDANKEKEETKWLVRLKNGSWQLSDRALGMELLDGSGGGYGGDESETVVLKWTEPTMSADRTPAVETIEFFRSKWAHLKQCYDYACYQLGEPPQRSAWDGVL